MRVLGRDVEAGQSPAPLFEVVPEFGNRKEEVRS